MGERALPKPLTLRDAIEQAIKLGEHDPHTIASTIRKRYDEKWFAAELLAIADNIVADLARAIIGSSRRSSLSLEKIAKIPKREVMLQAYWLGPAIGWVKLGKFTAANWFYIEDRYRDDIAAFGRWADLAHANGMLMLEQGVEEFGQVKGPLPALPPAEEAA